MKEKHTFEKMVIKHEKLNLVLQKIVRKKLAIFGSKTLYFHEFSAPSDFCVHLYDSWTEKASKCALTYKLESLRVSVCFAASC